MKAKSTTLSLFMFLLFAMSNFSYAISAKKALSGTTAALLMMSQTTHASLRGVDESQSGMTRNLKKKQCKKICPKKNDGDKLEECSDLGEEKVSCIYPVNGCSCPTDDEVGKGYWFDNKKCNVDGQLVCNYEPAPSDEDNQFDKRCKMLCPEENDGDELEGCSDIGEEDVSCKYPTNGCSCPTDSDIGNGYWFNNKDCNDGGQLVCNYEPAPNNQVDPNGQDGQFDKRCKKLCPEENEGDELEGCSDIGEEDVSCRYPTNGCSCPTDSDIGNDYWFNNKDCNLNGQLVCNYEPNPKTIDTKSCKKICLKKSDGKQKLKSCFTDKDELTCVYSGKSNQQCCGCPTDSDIGNGFEFDNKVCFDNGKECTFNCNYN